MLRLILPASLALVAMVVGLAAGLSAASRGWLNSGRQPSNRAAIRVFRFIASCPYVVSIDY
ncbi:hypothetical protein D3C78_1864670 [compost metagenome]